MNDTVAMIASANTTLQDSSRVGNGLKTIAINLAGIKANASNGTLELNKTAKALKEIAGISVFENEQTGELKNMPQLIDEIASKWSSFTEEQRAGLSEGIAGKEQAAVFQSLMSNYDTMKQVQQELNEGMHFGSALAENEQYVDSLKGKLNKLKEVWVGIFNKVFDSNSAKGLLDVLISVSEAIDKVVGSLDEMGILLPSIIGMFGGVFSGFKGTNFITDALKGANKEMSIMQKGVTVLGSGLSKAGTFLGNFITQGLLIGGITILVQGLIKAWDKAANGLKNAEKEITNSIESINSEISQDTQDLKYLEETEKRYNELIKKKEEYSNIPIESMSEEQLAEMKELEEITDNLAKMFPELVIGYDSNNQPILLMADDMETLQERTKEQIELNKELLRVKREELAENARKQYQEGNFFGLGSGIEESVSKNQAIYDSLYNSMIENESSYTKAVLEGDERRANKIKKTLDTQKEELNRYYKENLQLYQEYTEKEIQAQQSAFDQIQTIKGYDNLDKDASQKVQTFMDNLNWVNMDESQYSTWLSSFDEIIKLAGEGSPKLQKWSDALELANEKYAATGNVDSYNKSISELAKTISKDLGIDYETVFAGLETMVKPLTEAETKMNSFLESFGKTRYDLLNGDAIAMQLAEQFQAVEDTINKVFNNREFQETGVIKYDLMTEIANSDELPDQIQSLASALAKDGVSKAESDLMLELMMSIRSGDKEMIETTIENVNSKLKELDMEEHTIDIKTLFDESGTKKVEKLEEKLKNLPKETKTLVETDVLGEEDLETLKSLLNDSTLKDDKVIDIIVENQDAINKAGGLKEWLDSIPKETWAKLGVKAENVEEAKKDLEEVSKKQDEIDSKDVNLSVNKGELQGSVEDFNKLIEYSTKLKDGEYQISFKSDTTNAIAQIDNLKLAVNNLSNQFREIPTTTVTIHTALAAQNISGLLVRISQVKTAIEGIKGKTIQIATALAAKNLSGLITRVNQYRDAINNTPDKTCNIHTSTSAKNLSGLIRKIESYNGTKIPQKTVSVNVSNAIKQVQTLLNKINALPRNKTVSIKVSQSGSVTPKVTPRSIAQPQMENAEPSNKIGLLSDNTNTSNPVNTRDSVQSRATVSTPIASTGADIRNSMKYSIELLKELENRIDSVSNSLSILDKKAQNATGEEKINYLKQQNTLYLEQLQLQKDLEDKLTRQLNHYKAFLQEKGFTFTSDGNLKNYEEKLILMEKEAERLEKVAEAKQKAYSDYKGDNENTKNSLSSAYDKAKESADKYKDSLSEIKKYLDEYIKVAYTDLPGVKEEFIDINNAIQDNINSINEFNRELKNLRVDSGYKDHERDIWEVENKLDLNEIKLENAAGEERNKLLAERIELYKQLQRETQDLLKYEEELRRGLMSELNSYGFKFRDNGSIENYSNIIENLKKTLTEDEFERVFKKVEEYLEKTYEVIPDLEKEWLKFNNQIKDTAKEIEELKKALKDLYEDSRYKDNERDILEVENKLDKNEIASQIATGQKEIDLLKERIELQKQLQKEKQDLLNFEKQRRQSLMSDLSKYGFNFRDDGSIIDYGKIIGNLKQTLSEDEFDSVFEKIEDYLDTTYKTIPDIENEWQELNNAIKQHEIELKKLKLELTLSKYLNKLKEIENEYDKISDRLDIIDIKLENAYGKDKLDLLNEQIKLLEEQMQKQKDMESQYKAMLDAYQSDLTWYGFKFNTEGDILNLDEILNEHQSSAEIEHIKELVDEYLDIQRDKLPDAQKEWEKLSAEIKNVYKEQLNITKEIEDKITQMYKKQIEDRISEMEKETDAKIKSLKKQQEAYNKYREEVNYKDEYEEKLADINELQRQLDIAMRDTSLQGQKKVQELQKLLAEAQKELDKLTQDKIDSDINDKFDDEMNRIEETNQSAIEALEKEWSDSKIAEMVSQAISTGIFEGIDGKISGLQDAMLEFAQETGELFGVMGTLIKSELITNLDIAMNTFKDLGNIIKNLDLEKFSTLSSGFNIDMMRSTPSVASTSSSLALNAPMINIEGNVDRDVIEDLKSFGDKIVNDVINKISSSIR